MTARIIDGKQLAADMRAELKSQVEQLKAEGIVPGLAVVLVGEDPARNPMLLQRRRLAEKSEYSLTITGCPQRQHNSN